MRHCFLQSVLQHQLKNLRRTSLFSDEGKSFSDGRLVGELLGFSPPIFRGRSSSSGALVFLEGLDRCWKTTRYSRLHKYLESPGYSAELWRFPNRITSYGQIISSYLYNKLQLDDRIIHLLLVPTVGRRVAFSSAKRLDLDWFKAPEIVLLALDMVLYLDIPPEFAICYCHC